MFAELEQLKIITLNCWGLRYVSAHRHDRIKLIAQHLAEHDYDIVFLQEVWIQSDFEYIRSKTKSNFKFAHMFNNASILGTSGLVILAKWIPKMIHFHPYSINGSPFRFYHGDWFSTKGVAYARIEVNGLNIHLFCTHMHAKYDDDEKITDQYSVHRICQSYELAKFINLMACNCSSASTRDLIVLAGDMNTSSKELPYRLLVELTDLKDCYKDETKKNKTKELRKKESSPSYVKASKHKFHCSDESSDEELITCGHKDNIFTPKAQKKSSAKRIDFILYKLRDVPSCSPQVDLMLGNGDSNVESPILDHTLLMCHVEQMKILAKDVSGLSFSDHQPVVAKLNLSRTSLAELVGGGATQSELPDVNEDDECQQDGDCDGEPIEKDQFMSNSLVVEGMTNLQKLGNKLKQKLTDENLKPLQLRQIATNMLNHQFSFGLAQPPYKRLHNSPLLHNIEDLLEEYLTGNKPALKYHLGLVLVLIILFIVTMATLYWWTLTLTTVEAMLISIIFMIVASIYVVLKLLTHRSEMNAVKAILNDIRNKKSFTTEYGLLEGQ